MSNSFQPHGVQHTGPPILHRLLDFAQIHLHWVGDANYLILCRSLLLLFSIFPSIRVFSNESTLSIRWPKYWSFSFSIRPSTEYSGLISFRMDWLDLLAVQGTLKSLLQHHSSKASVLYGPTLITIQAYWKNHSFDYMDLCRQEMRWLWWEWWWPFIKKSWWSQLACPWKALRQPLLCLLFGLSPHDHLVPPVTPDFRSVSFWPTTPWRQGAHGRCREWKWLAQDHSAGRGKARI